MKNLLIRTPKPYSMESFRGYLLRLSELNGLSSPTSILKLAGLDNDKMRRAENPIEVLLDVTGHDLQDMAHLPLTHPTTKIQQMSGHPLSKGYSIISSPKMCPACIVEHGYTPAYWDLLSVQGCHTHRKALITTCPNCSNKLSWDRPGLLHCKCGFDLSNSEGELISIDELEFLQILNASLNNQILENQNSSTGLPFKYLSQISLSTMLAIVHTLGSMQLFLNGLVPRAKACTHADEVRAALEVLMNWPNNFNKFLEKVGEKHGKKSLGLDGQFGFFTQRFFKRGYPEAELEFLKKAFISYGQNHWGNAFYYSRMRSNALFERKSNFVGINEFAQISGHSPSTVRKMIIEGCLVTKKLRGPKVEKIIIDIEKSNVHFPAEGNIISPRQAGKFLGLPVSVLIALRKSGVYKTNHFSPNKGSFSKEDLEGFKQKVIACQTSKQAQGQLISLKYVMRKSFKNNFLKPLIIQKILDHSLECFGNETEILDIAIKVFELNSLVDEVIIGHRDWLNINQTCVQLNCDRDVIPFMLNEQLLEGSVINGEHHITKNSITAFKQNYVSLQELSFSFNLGVKSLVHLCKHNAIGLQTMQRKSNGGQNFISRSAVARLANVVKDYFFNHKKLAYRCRLQSLDLSWANA